MCAQVRDLARFAERTCRMDASRFDELTRFLSRGSPRRQILVAMLLGAVGLSPESDTRAGILCSDFGEECTRPEDCCSGICTTAEVTAQGKRKRRKKRRRRRKPPAPPKFCQAHDTGGCQVGQGSCGPPGVKCPADQLKFCFRTTGNAPFCGSGAVCRGCTTDDECRTFCGDQDAACIFCDPTCGGIGATACVAPDGCTPG